VCSIQKRSAHICTIPLAGLPKSVFSFSARAVQLLVSSAAKISEDLVIGDVVITPHFACTPTTPRKNCGLTGSSFGALEVPSTRQSFLDHQTFLTRPSSSRAFEKIVSRRSCRTHHCAMFDSRSLRLVAPIARREHLQIRLQFSGVRSVSLLFRPSFTGH
jgi:hypothetical protein